MIQKQNTGVKFRRLSCVRGILVVQTLNLHCVNGATHVLESNKSTLRRCGVWYQSRLPCKKKVKNNTIVSYEGEETKNNKIVLWPLILLIVDG